MKGKRNNNRKVIQVNQFIDNATKQLVNRFNADLDSADIVLAKLEAMSLILNKATLEKTPADVVLRAFKYIFSTSSAEGYISEEFEAQIKSYLISKQTQN